MFADFAKIFIQSGKGGDGHVSFRRELYIPNGGPNGGDGGKGGDVIFEVDKGLNTLYEFRHKHNYKAEPGQEGGKQNKTGKNGADLIIRVPEGTIIREAETGKIVADMSGDNQRVIVLKGGRGGKGNQHYATATMQVPKYAQPGQKSMELNVTLELKSIADVGLVGFPNVGKSTLLSRVTNADPKIANYHFTTLNPNLGVVDLDGGRGFVIADIPGLIEGASEGVGLGHKFLKHIERTKVIIHMIDAASVAANKIDAIYGDTNEVIDKIKAEFEPEIKVFPISAVSGKGLKELLFYVREMLDQFDDAPTVYEQEYNPEDYQLGIELPYTVEKIEDGLYSVEGPRIERMLGYTNIDSEKGFMFFQNFMKDNGILEELENLGIKDGDTVKIYGHQFDYYK